MQEVDFKKYADIVVNLQLHNEYYWLIKHFDDDMLDHIRERFDQESGMDFMERFQDVCSRALEFQSQKLSPEDEQVQSLAAEFWGMVMEFTGGDMSMLPKLMEFGSLTTQQAAVNEYLQPALELYFRKCGSDPFQEVQP